MALKPGTHVVLDKPTPMTNLYLTMLDQMDIRIDQFGDSTGRIDPLSL